jgi:hypothetical protein
MSHIEKNISPFIAQQFPGFYRESGKNLVAFVRAYYEWLESEGNAIGYARSLLDYNDVDRTEQQFIDQFRKTYLSSIPKDVITDERLLVKHVLDLYRSKGSKRAVELLFRILFNEDIDVYVPGDFLLRPSDGEWTRTRYIETTSHPKLAQLVGKTISSSDGTSLAVVENSFRKVVSGKTVNVIYLSAVRGQFKYGDKIICEGLIGVDDAPIITGSLTAIAIENGGANFSTGDILSVTGGGAEGKARVASVRDENGKVRFTLVDGGSGFSINPAITVRTTLNLVIDSLVGEFSVGSSVQSTTTSANGDVVFANTSYLTLVDFSTSPRFVPGETITDGTATATVRDVFGGGGSGATFQVGGLVNEEILLLNRDIISNYLGTQIETQVRVNISSPTGVFTAGNSVISSANACILQVQYNTPNTAIIGERYSNTTLGIANLYVYNSDAGLVYVTGSESDLTSANLVAGSTFVGNTSSSIIQLLNTPVKETVTGNGTIFSANSSTVTANIDFGSSYFVPTAKLIMTGNTAVNATIVSQESLTNWGFPEPLPDISNLDQRIDVVLDIYELEVGTIAFLKNINPGEGYSSPPYVDVIQSDVALLGEIADNGGIKGHNATINTRVSNEQGVVTAVEVYDSGFGYVPGESVFLSKDGIDFSVSGIAVIDTDGRGAGYYVGKKGFLSDIMKIQDSEYYQIYSYEIVAKRMIDTYEKLVNDLVHPAGYKLFGRYRSLDLLNDDASFIANSSTSQSNTTTYTIVDTNFIANTATFTRASNGTFYNAVMQVATANTNIPRFEFSNVATYSGLLIEGARTNLSTHSEEFNLWSSNPAPNDSVGVANQAIAPDGTLTADLFLPSTSLGSKALFRTYTGAINTTYTASVFVKAAGYNFAFLNLSNSAFGANAQQAFFNLTTGAIVSQSAGANATITPVGNGWYRISVAATSLGTAGNYVMAFAASITGGSLTYAGDGVSGIYAWGAQVEAAPFASSYIRTDTVAVTRAADLLNVPLSSYGIDIDGGCTVLVSGLMPLAPATAAPLINLRRGGQNSAGALAISNVNGRMILGARNVADGNVTAELASTDFRGQFVRAGFVVSSATGTVRGCVAGGSIRTIAWRPEATAVTARIGSSWTSGSGSDAMALFSDIRIVQILPQELSDSALQAVVAALPI